MRKIWLLLVPLDGRSLLDCHTLSEDEDFAVDERDYVLILFVSRRNLLVECNI